MLYTMLAQQRCKQMIPTLLTEYNPIRQLTKLLLKTSLHLSLEYLLTDMYPDGVGFQRQAWQLLLVLNQ